MLNRNAQDSEKKFHKIVLLTILISFICSIPFDAFIIRADWEKFEAEEILQQSNPSGYARWKAEVDVDDPFNPYGDTPEIRYFSKPIHTVSFMLGIPFFLFLGTIVYMIYLMGAVFIWLPKVLRWIIVGAIYLLTCNFIAKRLVILYKETKKRIKQNKMAKAR